MTQTQKDQINELFINVQSHMATAQGLLNQLEQELNKLGEEDESIK